MRLGRQIIAAAIVLTAGGLASCGSGADVDFPPPPPPSPPPAPVVFSNFVKEQFANTADDTDPVAVDNTDFAFDDLDNPGAFDGLLGNP